LGYSESNGFEVRSRVREEFAVRTALLEGAEKLRVDSGRRKKLVDFDLSLELRDEAAFRTGGEAGLLGSVGWLSLAQL